MLCFDLSSTQISRRQDFYRYTDVSSIYSNNYKKVGPKRTSEQVEISVAFDLVTDGNLKRKTYHLMVEDYAACVYDDDWYIGVIEIICEEECDIQINFLHPKGPGKPVNCFCWSSVEDLCYITENDILWKISEPTTQATRRI